MGGWTLLSKDTEGRGRTTRCTAELPDVQGAADGGRLAHRGGGGARLFPTGLRWRGGHDACRRVARSLAPSARLREPISAERGERPDDSREDRAVVPEHERAHLDDGDGADRRDDHDVARHQTTTITSRGGGLGIVMSTCPSRETAQPNAM